MAAKKWDSGRVAIHDRTGLARLLRDAAEARFGGDPFAPELDGIRGAQTDILCAVAERAGLSRSLLYRIMTGSLAGTSWSTLNKLGGWLGTSDADALMRYALPPGTHRLRREYVGFVEREVARLRHKRAAKHDYLFRGKGRLQIEAFQEYVRNHGLPATRFELGKLRIVDPIVGWRQLRRALTPRIELAIIKDGLRRERRLVREEAKLLAEAMR